MYLVAIALRADRGTSTSTITFDRLQNDHDRMGPTLLVTGGAGFVGSSFAIHWKKRHPRSTVIALDNLKRRGSELNLPRLKQVGVQFVHGDVRQASDLLGLPHIDALVECSAEPSVLAGYGAGSKYVVDTNLGGTVHCLDLVARDKADLVFLSTSRVYPIAAINGICQPSEDGFRIDPNVSLSGASQAGIAEDFPLDGVRSLYGATKLASELLITEYADMHGIRAVIDRCGVIAGPWQMGKTDQGFVLLWLARHHWDLPLQYTGFGGTGSQVRDVLHVDDLCDLVTHQLEHMDEVKGRTFNAGGGRANSTTLRGFTELAEKTTGHSIPISASSEDRQGDLKLYITNNARIQQATGWAPKRDLNTVFSDSYTWLKEHEELLRPILT
jgi:CDP-paratose 2-epimerase